MASSSSSSRLWKHDVFLSFRGQDTRKTFVDHMYSALFQQGIHTYKDNVTLPRGESIAPALSNAIEESRIAVIIFSENYADSSWCLDELAYIMKCKDTIGQIVMPVFYHVDPSDVRKQKGKFGEAFAKLLASKNNYEVESWRKALVDASNLAGWEPKHIANGHESKVIKEIVDTISNRLFPLDSNVNDDLIGIWARLQDLKSKLAIGSGDVRIVGVWGLGGGGKTTLASSLYGEISSGFHGCCFLENIREKSSREDGLEKLQKKVLADVLKQKEVEVGRVEEGRRMIKSRLCHRNVLIVLDDVDHLEQLKALAGSHNWFGEGSRIIITTRDEHLLKAHKVDVIHNISLLNDVEAIQLFCKHAFSDYRPIEDYETLSKEVVSYAGGLPLGLKVMGCFLCDKDTNEWRSALVRLKEIPESDIVEKLKISFNGLKPVEKELFLDIACFHRGKDKDKAMGMLDACGFHPVIGIKVLIQKALITVDNDGAFDMHDLVQEMGHYIVRGEHPNNPEKHSRVWKRKDILKIYAMDATTENDRIEALAFNLYWDKVPWSFPQVVANMKKLRWICGYNYQSSSLLTTFQPKELCYLGLWHSNLIKLWEGYKHLPNLKVFDLHYSDMLIKTPDLSGLPCLEILILRECHCLKKIHPSIGYHEKLVFIDMGGCPNLEMFPPIIRMKKLETLILSGWFQLRKFPEIQTNMDSLLELKLDRSGIEVVPSSIGKYCTNLVSLDLSFCTNLKRIESNFHLLKHMKKFLLDGCERLEVPTPSAELSISFPMKLPHFPHFLTSLNLSYCNLVDGDIPYDISYLSNLKTLDLRGNKFSRIGSSLSQPPRLKFLNLSYCRSLAEFPDLPSSIAILEACWCDSLQIVGDFLTNCKWLWKVSLRRKKEVGRTDVERVVQSMLEGYAIEGYFMSLHLGNVDILAWSYQCEIFRLQLPRNWYNDFIGFFICVADYTSYGYKIVIKQETDKDLLQVFDETPKSDKMSGMCYISFGSLRHTSWWNSLDTPPQISFSIRGHKFKVELVPRRKSKRDSIERAKPATDWSEFLDEEVKDQSSFFIEHDSKSCLEIEWVNTFSSEIEWLSS